MKKEKDYKVSKDVNGNIQVSIVKADGKTYSASSPKILRDVLDADGNKVDTKLETRAQVIKRLCKTLNIEY